MSWTHWSEIKYELIEMCRLIKPEYLIGKQNV